ncbi:MAG: hypothetical protein ACTSVZ_08060 [Promethearchaeota archaeon]
MVKSDPEIIKTASEMMLQGKSYREIQDCLFAKYKSGLSNNTLKKIKKEQNALEKKDQEIARLRRELNLFKKLYFELLEATEKLH